MGSLTRAGGKYPLSTTQSQGTMAGRPIVREADRAEFEANPTWAPDMSPLAKNAKLEGKTEADLNKSLWEERGYSKTRAVPS